MLRKTRAVSRILHSALSYVPMQSCREQNKEVRKKMLICLCWRQLLIKEGKWVVLLLLSFPLLCIEQDPCMQVHLRKLYCHPFVYESNFRLLLNYIKGNIVFFICLCKISGAVPLTNMPAVNLIRIEIAPLSLGHCWSAESIMTKYFQATAM